MIAWVFFFLSKLLDLLLAPLTWALLLLLAAVLWRRRRAAPWLAGAAALLLYGFSIDPVANGLARFAEAPARRTLRPDAVYDVAVVLSGGIDPAASRLHGETELNAAGDRVVAGYDLLRSGRARVFLLSGGGPDPAELGETDWGAALYRRLGVPADRIVLERESRNTRENAEASARIVRARGWKSVLLVTSALHAPRALETFHAAGLSPDLLPVDFRGSAKLGGFQPRAAALDRSTDVLRELAGRLVYRAAGFARS
jgi:uncharacterized SAM-binding protein YcdF (DUF218 family)